MTTDGGNAGNAPRDLTYAEALAAAQPRIADFSASLSARIDQFVAVWQEVEPSLRAWVTRAATLTEQQWMDEAESTRTFYETWRQWFAEHDAEHDPAEHDAEQEPKQNAE